MVCRTTIIIMTIKTSDLLFLCLKNAIIFSVLHQKSWWLRFFSPSNCLVRISKMITRHCLLGDKTRILVKCAGINHEHIFLCPKYKNYFTFLKTKVWQDFCCFVWLFGKNNPFFELGENCAEKRFQTPPFFCLHGIIVLTVMLSSSLPKSASIRGLRKE